MGVFTQLNMSQETAILKGGSVFMNQMALATSSLGLFGILSNIV